MPFNTTKVISPGWSRHHAPTATGGMNAAVTIGVQTGSTYDPATDQTSGTWSVDYAGPARIQSLNQASANATAGQDVVGRSYLVQLDFAIEEAATADLVPGARVKVLAATNDHRLIGQDLWVLDVQSGSERFTRDLVCSDNQTDAPST